jgi:prophage antirepressor-like protein
MCFTEQGMRKFIVTADTPRAREVEARLDKTVLPAMRN